MRMRSSEFQLWWPRATLLALVVSAIAWFTPRLTTFVPWIDDAWPKAMRVGILLLILIAGGVIVQATWWVVWWAVRGRQQRIRR
jgi:hypothetical protein